MTSSFDENAA